MSHACVNGVVDILVAMFVHCSHLEVCGTKLSVTCPWLRSSTMELYVKCQLCEPCLDKCRDGTNICILHKEKGCSDFDCGHYIPLSSSGLSCEAVEVGLKRRIGTSLHDTRRPFPYLIIITYCFFNHLP